MRTIILFAIFFTIFLFATICSLGQIHTVPLWTSQLPDSKYGEIYSIGVSDPRSEDFELAKDVAIQRALAIAVLMHQMKIYYVADYFEARTEEHRWYILEQTNQEMSRFNASAFIDDNSFEVIEYEKNTNDEVFVLLRYLPKHSNDTNFHVNGRFFRQDFEVSNTRAMESIKTLTIETSWEHDSDQEPLETSFKLTSVNNYISTRIVHNNIDISPPNYSYRYFNTDGISFNITNYQYGVSLSKGYWIAFIESFVQSVIRISRNYSSRMGTVFDDYDTAESDDLISTSQKSLNRQACINTLGFKLNLLHIHEDNLFPNLSMNNELVFYNKPPQPIVTDTHSNEQQEPRRSCWFLNLFRKR